MPHSDSSAATITPADVENFGRWREGIIVLLIVLAPIGLAAIVMTSGLALRAAWQIGQDHPVDLPRSANIRLCGLLSYVAGSWIAVVLAWLWSRRRGMQREVFAFRGVSRSSFAASIVGAAIVIVGVPIVTRWVTLAAGSSGPRIDTNDARSIGIAALLFVATTPICEEILYRGLLVAWLRRRSWTDVAILLLGSFLFAVNHLLPLGLAWSLAMMLLGIVLFALRLRYESLTPAWLAHTLFNAQLVFVPSLSAWIAASQAH